MRKLNFPKSLTLFILLVLLIPISIAADPFEPNASYTVCFTPGENCTQDIVNSINSAVKSIWVQAYSFTSRPISKALVMAKDRGVQVQVIFDKATIAKGGTVPFFAKSGIPMWVDEQPAIAHNKVIIIDQVQVITGSFNFTRAAQENNAENVLIINDAKLAQKYLAYWQQRKAASTAYANNDNIAAEQSGISELEQLWQRLVNWFKQWF